MCQNIEYRLKQGKFNLSYVNHVHLQWGDGFSSMHFQIRKTNIGSNNQSVFVCVFLLATISICHWLIPLLDLVLKMHDHEVFVIEWKQTTINQYLHAKLHKALSANSMFHVYLKHPNDNYHSLFMTPIENNMRYFYFT